MKSKCIYGMVPVLFLLGNLFSLIQLANAQTDNITPGSFTKPYSALLSKYVSTGPDGVNLVDYAAWKANETDRQTLKDYIASFKDRSVGTDRDTQFANWINIYNAVTLEHILERYPIRSIRSGYIVGPWKSVKTIVNGEEISLHDIEHVVLRKEFVDPRLHYAINCASIGCPNLLPKAWDAQTLEADLEAAATAYINNSRGLKRTKRGVRLSKIYRWFREDFGKSDDEVLAHIAEYASPELQTYLKTTNPKIRGYDYDWALNVKQDAS